jgi:hypothetical protein
VLYGDINYLDEKISDGIKIELWFNTRLFELMSGFPSYYNGPIGNKNYRILFRNYYNNNVQKMTYTVGCVPITYDAIQVSQEISTLSLLNPVASIVFTSSYIPILSTNISPPKFFYDSGGLSSTGNNAGVFNILTDFEVPFSATNQYRGQVDYVPGTEYRLLDMNSLTNLNRVDINVYWKTQYGEYIPFKLEAGCTSHLKNNVQAQKNLYGSIKILFKFKNIFSKN